MKEEDGVKTHGGETNKRQQQAGEGEEAVQNSLLALFLRRNIQDLKYGIRYFTTAPYIRHLYT